MIVRNLNTITEDTLDQLISSIPFYKTVRQLDEKQYHLLLDHSRLVHYQSGEQVLQKGCYESWSYFLVKGQLVVSINNDNGQSLHVNYITPGEVFGDLSALVGEQRSADVFVDKSCREAVVFGTNLKIFGDLNDFHLISLSTKLIYYRNATHGLRWKLEMYRSKHPDHIMASKHRRIKIFTGPKDTVQELEALHDNAVKMGELLVEWNHCFGSLSLTEGHVPPAPDLAV